MRHQFSLFAALLLTGASAIADPPAEPATAAPATTAQAPAETAPAAAPAPAPAAAAAATPAANTTTIKMVEPEVDPEFIPPPGFRTVKNGLNVVYCTTVKPTGSNLPQKYCLSREQVIELQKRQEANRRELQQKGTTCSGGGCGGS